MAALDTLKMLTISNEVPESSSHMGGPALGIQSTLIVLLVPTRLDNSSAVLRASASASLIEVFLRFSSWPE